jgi:DNA-binding HxlR family transcriptional regulator
MTLDPDLFVSCSSVRPPLQVGGKWYAQIYFCLKDGPRRFSEIQVPMRHVSAKVLTESLRSMERDGFLSRLVRSTVPRHVDYELTELGHSLAALVKASREWQERYLVEMIAARVAHEDQPSA